MLALAAGRNVEVAFEQVRRWKPRVVSISTAVDAEILHSRLQTSGMKDVEVVHGPAGTVRVATHPDVDFVVSAIVGVAGLKATYEAVRSGKTVGLANKECLVAAGELITAEARRQGKPSAHRQRAQCGAPVPARRPDGGGGAHLADRLRRSFLYTPKSQLSSISVAQALNHPTWKMGQRITIDSATLMNKGFEVIEACRLFNLPPSRVQVMVHPQSTIHSMVEFVDGSILAQFSVTDMRLPILYALTYPDRIPSTMRFPVMDLRHLEFLPPDVKNFLVWVWPTKRPRPAARRRLHSTQPTRWRWRLFCKAALLLTTFLKSFEKFCLQRKWASWNL